MYAPSSTEAVVTPDEFVVPMLNADPPEGVAHTTPPATPVPDAVRSFTVNVWKLNATVVAAFTETPVWVAERPAYVIVTS